MSSTLAIMTSDASLLRCQVAVLKGRISPSVPGAAQSVGLGYFEADNLLLRKKPADVGSLDLGALVADIISETLIFHAGATPGAFSDEDAQPLRHRRWLFARQGSPVHASAGNALVRELPDFLARQRKGTSAEEVLFLTFFRDLRDRGRADDFDTPADLVARALWEAAKKAESIEQSVGRTSDRSLFATNGRVLAAVRAGKAPLHYALLEGLSTCERCGLDSTVPEANPALRAHRRLKTVAVASGLVDTAGFHQVPERSAVTVGRGLHVEVLSLD